MHDDIFHSMQSPVITSWIPCYFFEESDRELQADLGIQRTTGRSRWNQIFFFFGGWNSLVCTCILNLSWYLDYNLMMVCFVTELNRQFCNNYLFLKNKPNQTIHLFSILSCPESSLNLLIDKQCQEAPRYGELDQAIGYPQIFALWVAEGNIE